MRIKKKLNNNTIITKNEHDQEIIVIGKGVGYGKNTHDLIDKKQITKIFVPENKGKRKKFLDMIDQIPIEFINISKQIISYARREYELILNESVYITLTDHIYSSVERIKEGIELKNKFQWEIKTFYPKEYEIGKKGLEIIGKETGLALDKDEASFIAMHIISSEIGGEMDNFYDQTNFIQQTVNIIKYYFSMDFDEESLDYYRFVTHLKFFWHRITADKNNEIQDMENDILEIIKNKRVEAYLCSLKVKQFIEKKYQYELTNEEILYLTIHISRLTQNSSTEE
ncbi:PRD domain-containing protein [Tetragenococcus halophilus]|uniref:BglG family transcription antiterminator LicT n=1 Tax=Tetragenococcus halophilus TaxID=51669 RepID=UPI0030CA06F1